MKISNVRKSLKNILPAEKDLKRKLKKTSVFLGKLMLFGLIFRAIVSVRPDTYAIQSVLASVTNSGLHMLGLNLQTDGALIIGENASYLVTQDCLGWKSMFAFIGLIFASTKNLSKEFKFILSGFLAIFLVNLIRVIVTVYLSYKNIVSFEIIHTVLWKWGLMLIVLFLWVFWHFNLSSRIKRTFIYHNPK